MVAISAKCAISQTFLEYPGQIAGILSETDINQLIVHHSGKPQAVTLILSVKKDTSSTLLQLTSSSFEMPAGSYTLASIGDFMWQNFDGTKPIIPSYYHIHYQLNSTENTYPVAQLTMFTFLTGATFSIMEKSMRPEVKKPRFTATGQVIVAGKLADQSRTEAPSSLYQNHFRVQGQLNLQMGNVPLNTGFNFVTNPILSYGFPNPHFFVNFDSKKYRQDLLQKLEEKKKQQMSHLPNPKKWQDSIQNAISQAEKLKSEWGRLNTVLSNKELQAHTLKAWDSLSEKWSLDSPEKIELFLDSLRQTKDKLYPIFAQAKYAHDQWEKMENRRDEIQKLLKQKTGSLISDRSDLGKQARARLDSLSDSGVQKVLDLNPLEQMLTKVENLQLGRITPKLSPLVYQSMPGQGVHIAVKNKALYGAIAAGFHVRRTPIDTFHADGLANIWTNQMVNFQNWRKQTARYGLVQSGIGSPEFSHLHVVMIAANQKVSSNQPIEPSLLSFRNQPNENLVGGLQGALSFKEGLILISSEYFVSKTTLSQHVSAGENLRMGYVFRSKLSVRIPKLNSEINASQSAASKSFFALTAPFVFGGRSQTELLVSLSTPKRQASLQAGFRSLRPLQATAWNTQTNSLQLTASLNKPRWPRLTISYLPSEILTSNSQGDTTQMAQAIQAQISFQKAIDSTGYFSHTLQLGLISMPVANSTYTIRFCNWSSSLAFEKHSFSFTTTYRVARSEVNISNQAMTNLVWQVNLPKNTAISCQLQGTFELPKAGFWGPSVQINAPISQKLSFSAQLFWYIHLPQPLQNQLDEPGNWLSESMLLYRL